MELFLIKTFLEKAKISSFYKWTYILSGNDYRAASPSYLYIFY